MTQRIEAETVAKSLKELADLKMSSSVFLYKKLTDPNVLTCAILTISKNVTQWKKKIQSNTPVENIVRLSDLLKQ